MTSDGGFAVQELQDSEERVVEGQGSRAVFAEHAARYDFLAAHVAGRRVLDVACGSGYGAARLRAAGAREVVGVDRDAAAVSYAAARYGADGLAFVVGDACAPPADGPFDVIASFETIEHLKEPERFLNACRGLLAPGGLFCVSTPYRRGDPGARPANPYHEREWRPDEFAALLRPHFTAVELFGQVVKLEKRRGQLSRAWAAPLAWLQGYRLRDRRRIYRLPGPRFAGLWRPFPAYVVALCS